MQLQSGADVIASNFAPALGHAVQRLVPLVLLNGDIHADDLRVLSNRAIRFGGKPWVPLVKKCRRLQLIDLL